MQPKKSILDEIRAVREDFARKHQYDVRRMVETLQEEQERSGRKVVSLPPRRSPPVKKAS